MYVGYRLSNGGRFLVSSLLAIVLFSSSVKSCFAGTTGTISGVATDARTNLPIAGVMVNAVSLTASYKALTSARGFYAFTGISPDTYVVSFQLKGYQATRIVGITVEPDQTVTASAAIEKQLVTIGSVRARSTGGAFQPTQTTDAYTVSSQQILTEQGKAFNNNEVTLITAQPGASLDASGYPVIRGGRENEEGIQFEGIDYVDAYANGFTNSLVINGVGSLQVIPGAGDASEGNAGTGILNLIAKRGTYPPNGTVALEAGSQTYWHDLGAEFGFATPNGRISNYFSFTGQRQAELYGNHNYDLTQIGECCTSGNSFNVVDDYVDNFIYKFGRDNSQNLQIFYQGQVVQYALYPGFPTSQLAYRSNQPLALNTLSGLTGLSPTAVGDIIPLFPGQATRTSKLTEIPSYNQPNQALKFQYNSNLNSSTYLDLRFARAASVSTSDFPVTTPNSGIANEFRSISGGSRTTGSFDISKQFNEHNLFTGGAKVSYVKPEYGFNSPNYGIISLSQAFGAPGYEVADYIPKGSSDCPTTDQYGTPVTCGYLSTYFPHGIPRLPTFDQTANPYFRVENALYANDQLTLGKNLRTDLGLRYEKANINLGDPVADFGAGANSIDYKEAHPGFLEPRIAASYRLGPNDAVRASYGSSIQYSFFSNQVTLADRSAFNAYNNIPSYDNRTMLPATYCGVQENLTCKSYADQLFWEQQNSVLGQPITPTLPETFANFDFSYQHQFPHQVGVKITPFYRRGYNATVSTSSIIGVDANNNPIFGPPTQSNFGSDKTTGVEFLLTKDADYGLSGSLSATYQNGFSNVVPLSAGEDSYPYIPPDSLALNKQYRVGFVSPFVSQLSLQYKTRFGLRVNPAITYIRGYPYGYGNLTAYNVNGKSVVVPNTNVTSGQGANDVGNYVDPANPGTYFAPVISATRGTPEANDPGGVLSPARFNTNLTLEYTPRAHKNVTLGVQLYGLFDNIYSYPTLNTRYQPVATGIAGPLSGLVPATSYPFLSQGIVYNYGTAANGVNIRGTSPYLIYPNNNFAFTGQSAQTPFFSLFYVQFKL